MDSTKQQLFGECLAKFVRLSAHDVAEILEHQSATRRRFGEIALAWGLCRPHHVWQAWWEQLSSNQTMSVDLNRIGVDAQSVAHVPADLAVQFRCVPLRHFRGQLVVATCERGLARAQAELPALVNLQVRFVTADAAQVDTAIAAYYPGALRPAATAGAA